MAAALLGAACDLYRRNLFLEATADRTTYRYHPLFATFLRERLQDEQPDRLPALHCLAAAAMPDSPDAVDHYLAARSWDAAASAIERIGNALMHQGRAINAVFRTGSRHCHRRCAPRIHA